MTAKNFIFYILTTMSVGFSFASALSLKYKWSWGMVFDQDLHVNGLLFGLSFVLINLILFVHSVLTNVTNLTAE
jgi:hypothetical protein